MNWQSSWDKPNNISNNVEPKPEILSVPSISVSPSANPWDTMDRDQLLMTHDSLKKEIEVLKDREMELRKYIVNRAFPNKHEGMNNLDLGGGYTLKAGVKFNYNLADNDTVDKTLSEIAKIGNQGAFIADRLVSWKPSFLLTEYRQLVDDADKGSEEAKTILKLVDKMLTIEDAAPTLEIKAPKGSKK